MDATIAHRPERIAALTGAALNAPLEPEHLARLFAAPEGAFKGVEGARAVPVINMVDDDALVTAAIDVARRALALSSRFDYVVLAAMRGGRVIDVVSR